MQKLMQYTVTSREEGRRTRFKEIILTIINQYASKSEVFYCASSCLALCGACDISKSINSILFLLLLSFFLPLS